MQRKSLVLISVLFLGLLAIAGVYWAAGEPAAHASALTELNIGNLSCGSCVSRVKDALSKVAGVDQIEISVTNGRGQMIYNPALTTSAEIARVVTDAGYPATVRLDLDTAAYQQLQSDTEKLSATYIARIGNRLLSRADFDRAVQQRGAANIAGNLPAYADQQLKIQVWQELKEREVLLAAADKNQIVVPDAEVELEIGRMKAANPNFESIVSARFESYERFFSQLKDNLIINHNIEQNVIAGLTTDREKQLRFSQWYEETLRNTNVVIYDAALKQAEATGRSACGGTCGGS